MFYSLIVNILFQFLKVICVNQIHVGQIQVAVLYMVHHVASVFQNMKEILHPSHAVYHLILVTHLLVVLTLNVPS